MAFDPTNDNNRTLTGDPHAPPRSPDPCETVAEDVRTRALVDLAGIQQKIDRAKRTLWALTAAARREPARIEAALAEIARLERDQQALFTRDIEAWMAERCAQCRSGQRGRPGA